MSLHSFLVLIVYCLMPVFRLLPDRILWPFVYSCQDVVVFSFFLLWFRSVPLLPFQFHYYSVGFLYTIVHTHTHTHLRKQINSFDFIASVFHSHFYGFWLQLFLSAYYYSLHNKTNGRSNILIVFAQHINYTFHHETQTKRIDEVSPYNNLSYYYY